MTSNYTFCPNTGFQSMAFRGRKGISVLNQSEQVTGLKFTMQIKIMQFGKISVYGVK